ncbi:hypothetical protein HZA76_00020 [Candidatus Roizmanbacteria bacterium]|nr:hypothetical protein [Candidatus Roizmanbacteria bacterium]
MRKVFSIQYLVSSIKTVFAVFILYTLYSILNTVIFAQTSIPLTVMPARNQIEVEPGEKAVLTVNFYNQSDDPISGFFRTSDFIVDDNQGTPRLIENIEEAPPKYVASNWFSLLYDRATLPAHNKVSLQATITVPSNAHPGGRYVAVLFQQGNNISGQSGENEEAGVGTNIRIASLIYIRVKGPISEKALVSRFFTPYFLEYGPVKVTTDILNRGDYHITPRGIISLTDLFSGVVDQKLINGKNVFPDASRSFETDLGTKWMVGRYKVNLTGSYGETGQVLSAATYVWVFPWRVAIVIILSLIIIYLLGTNYYKKFVVKENNLEDEIKKEQEEIEKLKAQLRKKNS